MLNQFALCLSARIVQSLQLTTSRQVHQSWDHSKEETRNKANRANLASFALPLWKKTAQVTNRYEWSVVISNNYLKTKGEDM